MTDPRPDPEYWCLFCSRYNCQHVRGIGPMTAPGTPPPSAAEVERLAEKGVEGPYQAIALIPGSASAIHLCISVRPDATRTPMEQRRLETMTLPMIEAVASALNALEQGGHAMTDAVKREIDELREVVQELALWAVGKRVYPTQNRHVVRLQEWLNRDSITKKEDTL